MKNFIFIILFSLPVLLQSQDLTGVWKCNDGGKYYLRHVNNTLWWYSDGSRFTNVFKGTIKNNVITGEWADVPIGKTRGNGKLTLKIESSNNLVRTSQTGNYGGKQWTRGSTENNSKSEEVYIPANVKSGRTSNKVLENGKEYTLQISGTFSVYAKKPDKMDALYDWEKGNPRMYRSSLLIDGKKLGDLIQAAGMNKSYRSDHIYKVKIKGKGKNVSLRIHDWGDYKNNSGGLTVKIL